MFVSDLHSVILPRKTKATCTKAYMAVPFMAHLHHSMGFIVSLTHFVMCAAMR